MEENTVGIAVKYLPIRHPPCNPSERIMRGLGTYCKIYSRDVQRSWPQLITQMENWLKTKVSSSTGYAAVELLTRETKSDLFRELLKNILEQLYRSGVSQTNQTITLIDLDIHVH
jgi:hypothetical protein